MKIVLDTNVLISGMLGPHSAAAMLLRMIVAGALDIAVDERTLLEYEEVAARPEFGIDPAEARLMLDRIRRRGQRALARPLAATLPDPDDQPFIEVAHAAAADAIVTGNRKHFPAAATKGIPVLSPRQAVDLLAGGEWTVKEGIAVYRGRARGSGRIARATKAQENHDRVARAVSPR